MRDYIEGLLFACLVCATAVEVLYLVVKLTGWIHP
jgi:hypothetical protein